jgi:hypothetical protein
MFLVAKSTTAAEISTQYNLQSLPQCQACHDITRLILTQQKLQHAKVLLKDRELLANFYLTLYKERASSNKPAQSATPRLFFALTSELLPELAYFYRQKSFKESQTKIL